MLQFKIFKIPVSVHWMFWLLAAFLGGAFRASVPADWHRVLVFMAAAFVSIIIHELGHALVGLKYGGRNVQIMLHGMGGLASFQEAHFSRKERILMTAAGPGASIALAIVFFIASLIVSSLYPFSLYALELIWLFFKIGTTINVFWSIINLMPIFPMDGGQILLSLLGPTRVRLTCIISFITLGILAAYLWMATHSIYNLVIMGFLGANTWKMYQTTQRK